MHVCAYLLTVMVFPSRLFSTDSLCMKHTSQNDIFEEWISFSAFCVILPCVCVCACVLPFSAATVLEDFEDDLYVQLMEESSQYIDSN